MQYIGMNPARHEFYEVDGFIWIWYRTGEIGRSFEGDSLSVSITEKIEALGITYGVPEDVRPPSKEKLEKIYKETYLSGEIFKAVKSEVETLAYQQKFADCKVVCEVYGFPYKSIIKEANERRLERKLTRSRRSQG